MRAGSCRWVGSGGVGATLFSIETSCASNHMQSMVGAAKSSGRLEWWGRRHQGGGNAGRATCFARGGRNSGHVFDDFCVISSAIAMGLGSASQQKSSTFQSL